VVYRHYEDPRFVAKIAIDQVGMGDNPAEYENQFLIKPYCAKTFQVTPCGTVGFQEKLVPLKNLDEFRSVADSVAEVIYYRLLGQYILEDFGTDYFMNWGIRPGYGVALLDYPYVYELDGKKIFCNRINPLSGHRCGGEIDYDDGFNHLYCTRCGKKYDAVELKKYKDANEVVINKGGCIPMKVSVVKGDKVVFTSNESDVIAKQPNKKKGKPMMNVSVTIKGQTISPMDKAVDEPVEVHVVEPVTITDEVSAINPIVEKTEAEETPVVEKPKKGKKKTEKKPEVIEETPAEDKPSEEVNDAVISSARKSSITIGGNFIPNEDGSDY
jgi:hypothetical protein